MAKPPGERTTLIRKAITDHPGVGNTKLASLLNEQTPGHKITANDIAKQKQLMKKLDGGGAARTRRAPKSRKKAESRPGQPATREQAAAKARTSSGLTTEDLTTLKGLAGKVGGVDGLIGYLELLRDIRLSPSW